jgi:predicted HAD superfamily Cof-like phosphohydrolase
MRNELRPSEMLAEFHKIFSPNESYDNADNRQLRIALLREEFEEYVAAEKANDLVEIADALADMIYIIYGTALVYKIPLDEIVSEVHRSNLSKLGDDGRPVRRGDGKILKGPNYFKPRIREILDAK